MALQPHKLLICLQLLKERIIELLFFGNLQIVVFHGNRYDQQRKNVEANTKQAGPLNYNACGLHEAIIASVALHVDTTTSQHGRINLA